MIIILHTIPILDQLKNLIIHGTQLTNTSEFNNKFLNNQASGKFECFPFIFFSPLLIYYVTIRFISLVGLIPMPKAIFSL